MLLIYQKIHQGCPHHHHHHHAVKLWVIYMSRNVSFIQFITSIFGIISQYAVRQITNQPRGCLRKAKLVLIFDGSALHLCYSNLFLQLFCQISNLYGREWFKTAWTLLQALSWCLTCCNITGVPFIVLIFMLQYGSPLQWFIHASVSMTFMMISVKT